MMDKDNNVTYVGEGPGNVQQGWLQMEKAASKALYLLGKKNANALTILHYMLSRMRRGTSGVVVSAEVIARECELSLRTVQRMLVLLREHKFVQVLKSGNTNVYIINSRVAWQGKRGARFSTFNAQITVAEFEQESTVEELEAESDTLINVPEIEFDDALSIDETDSSADSKQQSLLPPADSE